MNNKLYIPLLLLGFFLVPFKSFACGSSSCCIKEKTEKVTSCCKKETPSKKEEGCNKKCKHTSCRCTVSIFSVLIPNFNEIQINSSDFSKNDMKFFFVEPNVSTGYYFIWSPPNIG